METPFFRCRPIAEPALAVYKATARESRGLLAHRQVDDEEKSAMLRRPTSTAIAPSVMPWERAERARLGGRRSVLYRGQ